jgi:SAM-dependent methyltransferase
MHAAPLSVAEQVDRGCLVCPSTRATLRFSENQLATADGRHRYPLKSGVPLLLENPREVERYLEESQTMVAEYESKREPPRRFLHGLRERLERRLSFDYRSDASVRAFESVFAGLPRDALCLNVGGGPDRQHPALVNLNVGPFPNVDVVGDAHQLPYRDECVDGIACEAVLEHLKHPRQAVSEMFRVLKPGKKVFAATPFLQAYHGYPSHFQNFTLTGHQVLFESAGFRVLESGTCVGPMVALWDLATTLLRTFGPAPLRDPAVLAWRCLGLAARPLDRILDERAPAHTLASTTYVLAEKPHQA